MKYQFTLGKFNFGIKQAANANINSHLLGVTVLVVFSDIAIDLLNTL